MLKESVVNSVKVCQDRMISVTSVHRPTMRHLSKRVTLLDLLETGIGEGTVIAPCIPVR